MELPKIKGLNKGNMVGSYQKTRGVRFGVVRSQAVCSLRRLASRIE
jgi:hypothetical protein